MTGFLRTYDCNVLRGESMWGISGLIATMTCRKRRQGKTFGPLDEQTSRSLLSITYDIRRLEDLVSWNGPRTDHLLPSEINQPAAQSFLPPCDNPPQRDGRLVPA